MRRRRGLVQWFGAAVAALIAVTVIGTAGGLISLGRLTQTRELVVDRLDPALLASLRLSNALLNEESGVRGYALAGGAAFLEPYERGLWEERAALAALRRLDRDAGAVRRAAETWRDRFAEPLIGRVRRGSDALGPAEQERGNALFGVVRRELAALERGLRAERAQARRRLDDRASTVDTVVLVGGVALLLALAFAAHVLQRVAVAPLARLAGSVRRVARGAFDQRVAVEGAREVSELGRDVDAMRERILEELFALEKTRDDLQRSNAELEQFAYVASHDLQEPLRKVASFTQMLQKRYGGQLDDRADSYIAFAVDGARRMQDLINDLLAFSRVGRMTEQQVVVEARELVDRALGTLSGLIEETGATVEVGPLPRVRGEAGLLELVFRNLIGNGLKFRGEDPPRIDVRAEADGEGWRFTIADNGIGIEPEYSDRIFVIFQRLHPRTAYEGTGIGLAMCRKVIEYHGGRIWLDPGRSGGATFCFTLPAARDEETPAP